MLVYVMWCAGIAVKALAAYRMARNGLAAAIAPLFAYMVMLAAYAAILLPFRHSTDLYLVIYSAGIPFILSAKFAAVIGIFWALTDSYPNFRTAGSILLGIFATLGVGAAWASSFLPEIAQPYAHSWLWDLAVASQRYAAVAIIMTLASSTVLLPRAPALRLPGWAKRAALLMVSDAILGIISAWFTRSYAYQFPKATAIVATGTGIAVGLCWVFTKTYEATSVALPSPEETREAYRQSAAELHIAAARVDDAIRTLKRDY